MARFQCETTNDGGNALNQSQDATDWNERTHNNYTYPTVRVATPSASSTISETVPCSSKRKTKNSHNGTIIEDKEARISKEKLTNREYFKAWDKFGGKSAEEKVGSMIV